MTGRFQVELKVALATSWCARATFSQHPAVPAVLAVLAVPA
jgi:hypothetical protein